MDMKTKHGAAAFPGTARQTPDFNHDDCPLIGRIEVYRPTDIRVMGVTAQFCGSGRFFVGCGTQHFFRTVSEGEMRIDPLLSLQLMPTGEEGTHHAMLLLFPCRIRCRLPRRHCPEPRSS